MSPLASSPFWESFVQADWFGKSIFLGLFVLSITSWCVLLFKGWLAHQARRCSLRFERQMEELNKHPLTWDPPTSVPYVPNCFANIYLAIKSQTVEVLNKNRQDKDPQEKVFLSHSDIGMVQTHCSATISSEIQSLEKNLFILSMVMSLAPFLGLLGTVWGILLTFAHLNEASGGHGNQMMMSGLSMALTTTVLGLLVAIPALVAYHYLKNYIQNFALEMENFAIHTLAKIEIHYRKVEAI